MKHDNSSPISATLRFRCYIGLLLTNRRPEKTPVFSCFLWLDCVFNPPTIAARQTIRPPMLL